MSIDQQLMAPALAVVLALGMAQAPARADEPPHPQPIRESRENHDVFPWSALAPIGLSAGYIYTGQGAKAVLAPIGIYALTFGGMVLFFAEAWDRGTWKNPVGSLVDILVSPLLGAGLGFATGAGIVLVDQALTPHAGGPWMAPALSAGVVAVLIGTHVVLLKANSGSFADHHPGLALEQHHGLVGGDDRAAQLLDLDPRALDVGATEIRALELRAGEGGAL